MKLTWFGGSTLQIYIGGEILVLDPTSAPDPINHGEVVSGAGRVFASDDPNIARIDPEKWRPRPLGRAINDVAEPVDVLRISPAALMIAAPGEAPLVILGSGGLPRFGRWADGAVIVLHDGEQMVATARLLLDVARPRLIALAADEQPLDLALAGIAEHLDGVALVSLEPRLALEV